MTGKKIRKKHKVPKIAAIAVLGLIMVCVVSFLIWHFTHPEIEEMEQNSDAGESETSVNDGKQELEFPYALEDGQLEVTSIFQYTGGNPDCNDEMGENIAALEIVNKSDRHLASAQFTAQFTDGTEVPFEAVDVPAGQTVWAFARNHADYALENACESLTCTAQFESGTPLMEEKLSFTVNGTEVTLTNHSEEVLSNLSVSCHCLFDGEAYFGGKTYTYPVETIGAGESVTFSAEDCYLGEAAVVRISQGN